MTAITNCCNVEIVLAMRTPSIDAQVLRRQYSAFFCILLTHFTDICIILQN